MSIWIKRTAPFVIIAIALYAWLEISDRRVEAETARNQRYALAVAKVWVASAKLRTAPQEFIRFRDSLLVADSMSTGDVVDFVRLYEDDPENLQPFSQLVQEFVDSLLDIEDSLALVAKDSIRSAGKPTP